MASNQGQYAHVGVPLSRELMAELMLERLGNGDSVRRGALIDFAVSEHLERGGSPSQSKSTVKDGKRALHALASAGLIIEGRSVGEWRATNPGSKTTPGAVDAVQIRTEPDRFAAVHISQAFRVGDLVFVSGQAAVDDDGRVVGVGDFESQARAAVGNLKRVLEAAGSSLDQVIKVTIFLTDMDHFSEVIELRKEVFTPPYPADTICEVRALAYPELLFEIEAVALVEGRTVPA